MLDSGSPGQEFEDVAGGGETQAATAFVAFPFSAGSTGASCTHGVSASSKLSLLMYRAFPGLMDLSLPDLHHRCTVRVETEILNCLR